MPGPGPLLLLLKPGGGLMRPPAPLLPPTQPTTPSKGSQYSLPALTMLARPVGARCLIGLLSKDWDGLDGGFDVSRNNRAVIPLPYALTYVSSPGGWPRLTPQSQPPPFIAPDLSSPRESDPWCLYRMPARRGRPCECMAYVVVGKRSVCDKGPC